MQTMQTSGAGQPSHFGRLLKHYRSERLLTQEELAERAGISPRSIRAAEQGESHPQKGTAQRLAAALGLEHAELQEFLAAAFPMPRRLSSPDPVAAKSFALEQYGPPTSFIGRTVEIAAITTLLLDADVHLLTLTGAGGVGKSRLALHAASILQPDFADGVTFVSLASLHDKSLVLATIAAAFALHEIGTQPILATLSAHLRNKSLLLLLDNFEHLVDAASDIAALRRAAPHVKLLITSRMPLRLQGEQLFPVPPLALPEAERDNLAGCADAVQLFVQRTALVKPGFALTPANCGDVIAIVRQLDGLPLALELAAARLAVLSLPALRERLAHPLKLLNAGARDLPERHQTLRDTIAWSYALLPEPEQQLFRRLSVCTGGCDQRAAVAICRECEEGETHLSDDAIAQGLLSLVEKNMVKAEEHPSGAPRFRMLMTIGEYGQELLESSGEATALRRRHAAFYLDFAKDAVTRLQGHEQLLWLQRLDDELDNLRTAFAWRGDQAPLHEQQLFVAGALYPFWHLRGRYTEGVMWLERLLSEPVAQAPTIGRTRALQTAAALNASLDKQSEAYQQCNESLAIAQALGDPYELAQALRVIGSIDATLSAPESFVQSNGVMQLEESVRLMRTTGNLAGTVYAIAFLGFRLLRNWDYQGALAQFTEGLQIARKLGDRWTTGMNLLGLAEATWLLGDGVAAHTYAMQSLEQHQLLGDQHGMGHVLGLIGDLAQAAGELETAQSYYQQSLETLRVMAEAPRTVRTLWGMATLAATAGHIEQALMLAGAATHLSQTALVTAYSPDDARLAPLWTRANQRLGEEQIRTLWAGGQAMTLNQAVAYARALPETIANPDHSSLPQAPTADARDAI